VFDSSLSRKGHVVGCSENDGKCGIFLAQMKKYRPLKEEYIPKSWTVINAIKEL
jgi:hypothetical protein